MYNEITKEKLIELFNLNKGNLKHYKKSGNFMFRHLMEGELIITINAGVIETKNTAKKGDVVIKNLTPGSSGEEYIMSFEKLKTRYTLLEENFNFNGKTWQGILPTGECLAFQYNGTPISFDASWGEKMICKSEDFLVTPAGGKEGDIYRIEQNDFKKTYKLI